LTNSGTLARASRLFSLVTNARNSADNTADARSAGRSIGSSAATPPAEKAEIQR